MDCGDELRNAMENEFEKYLIPNGMIFHFTMQERKAYYDDLKKTILAKIRAEGEKYELVSLNYLVVSF